MKINKREKIEEKTIPIKLEFPEYNLPTKRAVGMSLKEMSAEKIRAKMTREKARDLYYLHYLVEKKNRFNSVPPVRTGLSDPNLGFLIFSFA